VPTTTTFPASGASSVINTFTVVVCRRRWGPARVKRFPLAHAG
jgi:hypothetical protein